ncbi:hypothetical protein DFQ27_000928, partial [Actinomortierella ambigua]
MLFFIRIDDRKVGFVQMKLRQSSAKLYRSVRVNALATVSAASCIQDHAKGFQGFCTDNIYISMV